MGYLHPALPASPLTPFQLTKADEEATAEEVEVRREDQDKINKFSRLHQRELGLEENLQTKNVGLLEPRPSVPAANRPPRRRRRKSSTTST